MYTIRPRGKRVDNDFGFSVFDPTTSSKMHKRGLGTKLVLPVKKYNTDALTGRRVHD